MLLLEIDPRGGGEFEPKRKFEVICARHGQISIINNGNIGLQIIGDHIKLSPKCSKVEMTPYTNKFNTWLKIRSMRRITTTGKR